MLEILNLLLRIFGTIVILGTIVLGITSKEFHETLIWLIKGED